MVAYRPLIQRIILGRKPHGLPSFGNPQRPKIGTCPTPPVTQRISLSTECSRFLHDFRYIRILFHSIQGFGCKRHVVYRRKSAVGIGHKSQCQQIFVPASLCRNKTTVVDTHTQFPKLLFGETVSRLQHHKIIELNVSRVFYRLAIDIYLIVAYLERIARHTHATLHIILPAIDRAIHHFTELLFVPLHPITAYVMHECIVIGIGHPHGNRISRGEIKDDDISAFHFAKPGQPVIGP